MMLFHHPQVTTRKTIGRRHSRVRRRQGRAGSGLVEVMVTVGFVAVAFLGFAANTIAVARAHTTSRNAASATALAQQQLEALRNLPVGAPGLTSGTYQDPGNPLAADGGTGGIFHRSWTVSAPDTPGIGLKAVTVLLAWTDQEEHQTAIAAYVRCSTVPCP